MTKQILQRLECDRCKAQVELSGHEDEDYAWVPDDDQGWITVEVDRTGRESPIPGIPSDFDLCASCCQSLMKWFIARREE